MATIMIDEQGAVIGFRENRITISASADNLNWSIPKESIERVVIVGRATLSQQALDFFFKKSIPVSFMTVSGQFKGFLCGMDGKNVSIRMQQYQLYTDKIYRIETAKNIVRQKVNNLRYFLAKHNRYHQKTSLNDAVLRMKNILSDLESVNDIDKIMGIEGACAGVYFNAFGTIFEDKQFSFTKRTRRPPLDPVNAMLSLGYTLLLSEIISAVNSSGLDPYLGFLHSHAYGRPSLACDIQEEFRYIIDELIVKLINLNQVKSEHFEKRNDGKVFLTEQAREIFFRSYEHKMRQGSLYNGKNFSYRSIIQMQVQSLSKCLNNNALYEPFKRPTG